MLDRYGVAWSEDLEAGYMLATIDGEPVGHCTLGDDGKTWTACMDGNMPFVEVGAFPNSEMAKDAVSRSVRQFQTSGRHSR